MGNERGQTLARSSFNTREGEAPAEPNAGTEAAQQELRPPINGFETASKARSWELLFDQITQNTKDTRCSVAHTIAFAIFVLFVYFVVEKNPLRLSAFA